MFWVHPFDVVVFGCDYISFVIGRWINGSNKVDSLLFEWFPSVLLKHIYDTSRMIVDANIIFNAHTHFNINVSIKF